MAAPHRRSSAATRHQSQRGIATRIGRRRLRADRHHDAPRERRCAIQKAVAEINALDVIGKADGRASGSSISRKSSRIKWHGQPAHDISLRREAIRSATRNHGLGSCHEGAIMADGGARELVSRRRRRPLCGARPGVPQSTRIDHHQRRRRRSRSIVGRSTSRSLLDLAAGAGELTMAICARFRPTATVVGSDPFTFAAYEAQTGQPCERAGPSRTSHVTARSASERSRSSAARSRCTSARRRSCQRSRSRSRNGRRDC